MGKYPESCENSTSKAKISPAASGESIVVDLPEENIPQTQKEIETLQDALV